MLNTYRNLRALIAMANQIAAQNPGGAPRWTLFVTNRSFIALALAVILNVLALLGVPLVGWLEGIAPDALAGQVVEAFTAALALWAFLERLWGRSRVIWNRNQAEQAIEEAHAAGGDPLAGALRDAGEIRAIDAGDGA